MTQDREEGLFFLSYWKQLLKQVHVIIFFAIYEVVF